MRILVHLPSTVPAFQASDAALARLSARLPMHELAAVASEAELVAALPDADAAVVWRFLPEWYLAAPRLRHVFTPSAGREPLPAPPRDGVERHFGHFHGAIMGESLLAMIAFMNRRLGEAVRAQAARSWDRTPYFPARRLAGQVALLIGFGAIGQHAARLLSAIGMEVHGVRRDVSRPSPHAARVFAADQLLDAVALADHVACVLPGDTGSDRLLGAEVFARMKPSACVYNLGRGNPIDADALVEALAVGRVAGAFLDVTPEEPLPPSSPLWRTPNLYLTPHASAISVEYLDLYFEELATELSKLA